MSLCHPLSDESRYVRVSPSQWFLQRCPSLVGVVVSEPRGGTEVGERPNACSLFTLLEINGRCNLRVEIYIRESAEDGPMEGIRCTRGNTAIRSETLPRLRRWDCDAQAILREAVYRRMLGPDLFSMQVSTSA
ncbi:hypothetical protein GY45DRAFT_179938 [Cubamyces sp. BRFM 1775]|nr:hypothetical protein GY45DRAFT_179938 [Cubamyces sp. BRFM 1775]